MIGPAVSYMSNRHLLAKHQRSRQRGAAAGSFILYDFLRITHSSLHDLLQGFIGR
jgi:hypothetical protein